MHVLVYVTSNQTAKTVAKFLYGGYMARLLSDRGASITSSIIEGTVQDPRCPMTADYALPPPD